MPEHTASPSAFGRALREPTFHFLLLAAALFALDATVGSRDGNLIEIDRAEIEGRIRRVEMSLAAPLSAAEHRLIEEAYIDEQILVREALAMGLEDDERIHDILAQKMRHVLSGDVIQPTAAELQAYYDANRSRYTPEPAVTVDEVVVATTDPLPAALADQFREGVAPERLVSDLPGTRNVLPEVTLADLTRIFGRATAALVLDAEPGEWVGPHQTVRGQHWLRVGEWMRPEPPPLDAVSGQVRIDWIAEEEEARLQQRVADLRARYAIVFTGEGAAP